jgi:rubrerythrin
MVSESSSYDSNEPLLLRNSEYNLITALESSADFLHSAVGKYIRDAEKDNKPELVKLWNKIKEDEQNHLKMLRNELAIEFRKNESG